MWDFRVLAEECITELEWLAPVCVGRGSFTSLRGLRGWLQFLHVCRRKVKEPGSECSLQKACPMVIYGTAICVTVTQIYSIWTEQDANTEQKSLFLWDADTRRRDLGHQVLLWQLHLHYFCSNLHMLMFPAVLQGLQFLRVHHWFFRCKPLQMRGKQIRISV